MAKIDTTPRRLAAAAVALALSWWPLIATADHLRDRHVLEGRLAAVDGPPTAAEFPGAAVAVGQATATDIGSAGLLVAQTSDDVAEHIRSAQEHAAANHPDKALESCVEAARIDPGNIEIRRHCGRYAEWAGDLEASIEQFEALLELAPDDEEGLLGAARAHGWSGHLARAAAYYQRYLEIRPDDADAWIEYARVQAWQGDFAAALDALDDYRERFGESERYLEEKARYLAWDNRPREALSINTPLLEEIPDDYQRLYTQAAALAADQQTDEALRLIDELEQLGTNAADTSFLKRVVRAPIRSTVEAGWQYYDDSDTIEMDEAHAEARLQLTANTNLTAGVAYASLHADAGSGFETAGGSERIRYTRTWAGGGYRFSPLAAVSGYVGDTEIDGGDGLTAYRMKLELRPTDDLEISLLRRRGIYALSPRAVSLDITRDHNSLALKWRPDLRHTVESIFSYDEFSDGNTRKALVLAPRRAVLRSSRLNADLGLNLDWMNFDEELNNGYYDPESYQRYAATLFGYYKLSEDHGLSMVGTAGFHKDDDMDDFEFGYDAVGELTLGIYSNWVSVLRAGYSNRYQQTGSYDGWNLGLRIARRF